MSLGKGPSVSVPTTPTTMTVADDEPAAAVPIRALPRARIPRSHSVGTNPNPSPTVRTRAARPKLALSKDFDASPRCAQRTVVGLLAL